MGYLKNIIKNHLINVNKTNSFDKVKKKIDYQLTKSLDDSMNETSDEMYQKTFDMLEDNKKDLKYKKNSNEQEDKTLTEYLQILKDNYLQKLDVLQTELNENNIKEIRENIKLFKIELIKNIYNEYNCFLVEIYKINENDESFKFMIKIFINMIENFKERIEIEYKKYKINDLESECGIIEESASEDSESRVSTSRSIDSKSSSASRGGKTKNKKTKNKKTRKIKK